MMKHYKNGGGSTWQWFKMVEVPSSGGKWWKYLAVV
jgi:hypothetical protein